MTVELDIYFKHTSLMFTSTSIPIIIPTYFLFFYFKSRKSWRMNFNSVKCERNRKRKGSVHYFFLQYSHYLWDTHWNNLSINISSPSIFFVQLHYKITWILKIKTNHQSYLNLDYFIKYESDKGKCRCKRKVSV